MCVKKSSEPGHNLEPNLCGLLVKIRVSVFDLAGGLWEVGGGGVRVEARGWREGRFRVIYAQEQTPGRKGF